MLQCRPGDPRKGKIRGDGITLSTCIRKTNKQTDEEIPEHARRISRPEKRSSGELASISNAFAFPQSATDHVQQRRQGCNEETIKFWERRRHARTHSPRHHARIKPAPAQCPPATAAESRSRYESRQRWAHETRTHGKARGRRSAGIRTKCGFSPASGTWASHRAWRNTWLPPAGTVTVPAVSPPPPTSPSAGTLRALRLAPVRRRPPGPAPPPTAARR
jgi:hypothetical protein